MRDEEADGDAAASTMEGDCRGDDAEAGDMAADAELGWMTDAFGPDDDDNAADDDDEDGAAEVVGGQRRSKTLV